MCALSHPLLYYFTLLSGADVVATDTESYTPLMVAAAAGHTEAFNFLLEKNSAIDDVEKEGKTILHMAARENHISILKVPKLTGYSLLKCCPNKNDIFTSV